MYVVPTNVDPFVNVQLLNVTFCVNADGFESPPLQSKFTTYPFGSVGFAISFVVL